MFFENSDDELEYESYSNFLESDLLIYVENEFDIKFWRFVLEENSYLKKFPNYEFSPYSDGSSQGKKAILKYGDFAKTKNGKVLICIDSDYDHLISKNYENPYILQTYLYSVENFSLEPNCLNHILKKEFGDISIDFQDFFKKFSEIKFHDFLNDIEREKNGEPRVNLNIRKIRNDETVQKYLENLGNPKANEIDLDIDIFDKNNLQLFLKGHDVFELTTSIIQQIQKSFLESKKENTRNSLQGRQLGNKIKEIENRKISIPQLLLSNCELCLKREYQPILKVFNKIGEDIQNV